MHRPPTVPSSHAFGYDAEDPCESLCPLNPRGLSPLQWWCHRGPQIDVVFPKHLVALVYLGKVASLGIPQGVVDIRMQGLIGVLLKICFVRLDGVLYVG
jgi:hypothetical protein